MRNMKVSLSEFCWHRSKDRIVEHEQVRFMILTENMYISYTMYGRMILIFSKIDQIKLEIQIS